MQNMLTLVVLALTALVVGCSEESGNSSAGSPATAERKLVPTFEIHVVEAYPYPKDEKQMSLFGKSKREGCALATRESHVARTETGRLPSS